ncbi:hypothetical protein [Methylophilus sp. DW102]|uniref:hypothetical protein n=1 Tax=Methylophilus sp. DW102 TaxID=3095607 RepID=UPI00308A665B|nr:PEP-CTERM sorting domain-containing protein [Methylophilus sp. DW102]
MHFSRVVLFVFFTLISSISTAQSFSLDFNSYAHDGSRLLSVGPSLEIGDYQITSCFGSCGADNIATWSKSDPNQADFGNAALLLNYSKTIELFRTDGGAFDLVSLDLAPDVRGNVLEAKVVFNFFNAPSETTYLNYDISNSSKQSFLEKFIINKAGLRSFSINGNLQIDNIVLVSTSVVPEPSMLSLMLCGS